MLNPEGNTLPVVQHASNDKISCFDAIPRTSPTTKSKRKRISRRPYLILNLLEDGQLSLSHWSEQDGITTTFDTNSSKNKSTYRQTLPTSRLGKSMARIHYEYREKNKRNDKNLRKANNNYCMNLMFHQWTQISWNQITNSYCIDDNQNEDKCEEEIYKTLSDVDLNRYEEALNDADVNDYGEEFYETLNDVDLNGINIKKNNKNLGCNSIYSSSYSTCSSDSFDSFDSFESYDSFDNDFLEMDRTTILATDYGPELFSKMMDNMMTEENTTMFQDFGMPFTFPLACAMTYAIQGQTFVIEEILRSLDMFWIAYEDELKAMLMSESSGGRDVDDNKTLIQDNKDNGKENCGRRNKDQKGSAELLKTICRRGMGWCGWYLYLAYYRMRAFTHVLPFTTTLGSEMPEEDKEIVFDAIGVLGLKLMRCGFIDAGTENSQNEQNPQYVDENESTTTTANDGSSILKQIVPCVRKIIQEEMDILLSIHRVNRLHVFEHDLDRFGQSMDLLNSSDEKNDDERNRCGLSAVNFSKVVSMPQKRILLEDKIFISKFPTKYEATRASTSHNLSCLPPSSDVWLPYSEVTLSLSPSKSSPPTTQLNERRRTRRRRPRRTSRKDQKKRKTRKQRKTRKTQTERHVRKDRRPSRVDSFSYFKLW